MNRVVRTLFPAVASVLFVLCLASPAHAQYCEQTCASGYGPTGYPPCEMPCNAGGGDYSQTCGSMGYSCCQTGLETVNVRSEWAETVIAGLYCRTYAIVDMRQRVECPGETYVSDTWCQEVETGSFFMMGGSCCEAYACSQNRSC